MTRRMVVESAAYLYGDMVPATIKKERLDNPRRDIITHLDGEGQMCKMEIIFRHSKPSRVFGEGRKSKGPGGDLQRTHKSAHKGCSSREGG